MKDFEQSTSITDRVNAIHQASQEPKSILDDLQIGTSVPAADGYMVAQQVPRRRNEAEAFKRACKDAEILAERAYYKFPMGGKPVEGPSVGLARCMASAWGNCVARARKTAELVMPRGDNRVLVSRYEGVWIDLETGANLSLEYEGAMRAPSKGFAKSPDEEARWYSMQSSVIQSKAQRNAIVYGLPAWFVQGCMEVARKSAANELLRGTTIEKAIDWVVEAFASKGRKVPELERVVGRPINAWSSADVIQMREIWQAIKSGDATLDDVFAEFTMDQPDKATNPPKNASAKARAAESDPNPLAGLADELAAATTDAQVMTIQKAWLKNADEAIRGDITTLCSDRLKALT